MHIHIILRSTAKVMGFKRYFTALACSSGHVEQRSTCDGQCFGCARDKRAKQRAEERMQSDIKMACQLASFLCDFIDDRYANKRLIPRFAASAFGMKTYYTGIECKNGHLFDVRVDSGLCVECSRLFSRELYRTNLDHAKRVSAKWRSENKEALAESRGRRRARNEKAEGVFTAQDVRDILERQKYRCASCTNSVKGKQKNSYHVDHVIPLFLGGSNWPRNLQILCPGCNLSKGSKHPIDWAQQNGRLL